MGEVLFRLDTIVFDKVGLDLIGFDCTIDLMRYKCKTGTHTHSRCRTIVFLESLRSDGLITERGDQRERD